MRKRKSVDFPKSGKKRRTMGSTSSSSQTVSTATGPSSSLTVPVEILMEIFLRLPPKQVVNTCRLVCHQWKDVADTEFLWRQMCRREGYSFRNESEITEGWRKLYFNRMMKRNLLKNPRAENQFQHWKILRNGGDRWTVEGVIVPHPDETVKKNFVTSYEWCKKSQLIDLKKEGYKPSLMDKLQPDIEISDWYGPRLDCSSEYEICVKLLNKHKKPVRTFGPKTDSFPQGDGRQWKQITHVFRDYGPGVRYIRFTHGGKDKKWWAGWYGIRVTDSSVEICPAIDKI